MTLEMLGCGLDRNLALCVQRLSKSAKLPTRGSELAIGADLYADPKSWGRDLIVVPAGGWASIPTGIAARAPEGCYLRVAPRSGLAKLGGIDVLGGVVDRDYTGEVLVLLVNHASNSFEIRQHDRIAQLICERAELALVIEVEKLEKTKRGTQGFGSSGR